MLIILNGPPGTGKDECCLYLEKKGFVHKSFKKALIKKTCKYFDVSYEWFIESYNDRTVKEAPSLYLGGMSRREALIYVSETIIKPKYGKKFFGKEVAKTLKPNTNYCFSDGGFKEELVPVINKVGADNICLVQLTRMECDFSSDSRRYLNGDVIKEFIINKETPINKMHIIPEKFAVRTYRIHNNGGIEELHGKIEEIYEIENQHKKIKTAFS